MDLRTATALLLDLDGTLVDTEPIHCEVHRELLGEHGIHLSQAEIYTNIGAGDLAFYGELMQRHGIDGDPAAWCAEKDRRMLARYRRGGLQSQPGVPTLLELAVDLAIPCCVVTSSRREMADLALAGAGLDQRLPTRVCWDDTDEHKPLPAPYLAGLARLDLDSAAGVVAIEDSAPGVTAAHRAGCRVVAVSHLVGADLLRAAGAHQVVTDLRELL